MGHFFTLLFIIIIIYLYINILDTNTNPTINFTLLFFCFFLDRDHYPLLTVQYILSLKNQVNI